MSAVVWPQVKRARMRHEGADDRHLAAGRAVVDVLVIIVEHFMLWQQLLLSCELHWAAPASA